MPEINLKYLTKKEGVDKARDIVFYLLDLFWSEFARINAESEKIRWPSLPHLISISRFKRRNSYKHIHQLKIYDILRAEGNAVWPSAFMFIINGRAYNPSHFLFENELPEELSKTEINAVTPKLPVKIISELIKSISVGNEGLDNFVSVSFGTEKYSYSQEYHYSKLPKTAEAFRMWGQEDKEIKEDEKRLYKILNPLQDPFNHNTLFDFKEGDSSPFIKIDETKKDYVLAGWCARVYGNQLIGDFDDSNESNSFIICFNKSKKIISTIPITFPSAKKGVPMMAQHLVIGTRIKQSNNPLFLGWYDFRNNIPTERWLMNHALVGFSKVQLGKDAEFIKIEAGQGSYFSLISIIPFARFPIDILEKRMQDPKSGRYAQDREEIFIFEKSHEVEGRHYELLKCLNEKLREASYTENKNILLIDSYDLLCSFSRKMSQRINELIGSGTRLSENLVRLMLSCMSASLLIPLSIKDKPAALNERIKKQEKEDYGLLKKAINHIIKTNPDNDNLPYLIITNYRQFRDLRLYFKGDIETKEFRRMIRATEPIIERITDINFRLEFCKWWLSVEKAFLEKGIFSGKTDETTAAIEKIYLKISKIYEELALFVEGHIKKEHSKETVEILENKKRLYQSLSLFFDYSSILFKTRFYMSEKKDRNIADIYSSLERVGKKLF